MHSEIIIDLQSKNMGIIIIIILFQASYSMKKSLQQQLLMISWFVRIRSHTQMRICTQHQLVMNCTKHPFKKHNLCATTLSLMHSNMIKLIYPAHKNGVSFHTRKGQVPTHTLFFHFPVSPSFIFYSSYL